MNTEKGSEMATKAGVTKSAVKAPRAKKAATEPFAIKNRWTGEVIFTAELTCSPDTLPSVKLGLAVKAAVKARAYLTGADLTGAYLTGAYLTGAYLAGASLARADLTGAYLTGAYLTGADLTGASLARAYLTGADLTGAYLTGADLTGAYLTRADLTGASLARAKNLNEEALRSFKADLFLTLDSLHTGSVEALHLIAKLRDGKVDGSTYGHGGNECACLVGTLAQPRGVAGDELDHNSNRPAERWFMMISPGDVPGKLDSEGKLTGGGYAAQKALEWVLDWAACHGVEVPALEAESAQ